LAFAISGYGREPVESAAQDYEREARIVGGRGEGSTREGAGQGQRRAYAKQLPSVHGLYLL
jgi:hypothetical protein